MIVIWCVMFFLLFHTTIMREYGPEVHATDWIGMRWGRENGFGSLGNQRSLIPWPWLRQEAVLSSLYGRRCVCCCALTLLLRNFASQSSHLSAPHRQCLCHGRVEVKSMARIVLEWSTVVLCDKHEHCQVLKIYSRDDVDIRMIIDRLISTS